MIKSLVFLSTIICTFLFHSPYVYSSGQEQKVFISEFIVNPVGNDSLGEWVELFNYSDDSIDLEGWKFQNSLLPTYILEPGEYVILVRNLANFEHIENKIQIPFNLVNTGDELSLYSKSNTLQDSFTYKSSLEGHSIQRSGPLCVDYIESLIHSISEQNTNYSESCYFNTSDDEVEDTQYKIEFSLNQSDWYDTMVLADLVEVYLRVVDSDGLEIPASFLSLSGNPIELPFKTIFGSNQKVKAILEDSAVEILSDEFFIYPTLVLNEVSSNYIEIKNINDLIVDVSGYSLEINGESILLLDICGDVIKESGFCIISREIIEFPVSIEIITSGLVLDSLYIEDDLASTDFHISLFQQQWLEGLPKTPGFENSYFSLQISELYPNTYSGEQEWIEIYNHGDFTINLADFFLTDKSCSDQSKNYLNGLVSPQEHLVFYKDKTKVSLNDNGDNVYLCSRDSQLLDTFSYKSSTKGMSLSRIYEEGVYAFNDIVSLLSSPTPGDYNSLGVVEEHGMQIIDIVKAKKLENGTLVWIRGTVSAGINSLYNNSFYVQDITGGVRVYFNGDYDSIESGQEIEIKGMVSTVSGEKRVGATEIKVVNSDKGLTYQEGILGENLLGMYVYAEGFILNNYASSFDISTKHGVYRVSVLSSTGINLPKKAKGDYVYVKGILQKQGEKLRILPFLSEDISIINSSSVNTSKKARNVLSNYGNKKVIKQDSPNLEPVDFSTNVKYLENKKEVNYHPQYLMLFSAVLSFPILLSLYGDITKYLSDQENKFSLWS
jgi:hypothetical protein